MPNIVLGLSRQSRTSTFQIFFYHLLHFKKWWKCCFILKALLSSRYLNFCLDILVKQKTFSSSRKNGWLERLIFKFINVTTWLTNDCNTHLPNISRSKSQLDNEIWSGNRITIYFFCKSCRKWARETRAAAWFQYISISLNLAYNKNNL